MFACWTDRDATNGRPRRWQCKNIFAGPPETRSGNCRDLGRADATARRPCLLVVGCLGRSRGFRFSLLCARGRIRGLDCSHLASPTATHVLLNWPLRAASAPTRYTTSSVLACCLHAGTCSERSKRRPPKTAKTLQASSRSDRTARLVCAPAVLLTTKVGQKPHRRNLSVQPILARQHAASRFSFDSRQSTELALVLVATHPPLQQRPHYRITSNVQRACPARRPATRRSETIDSIRPLLYLCTCTIVT